MIPKVMNFFWGNGPRMSFMRWLTLRSFRSCNPDWDMVLHETPVPCRSKTWASREEDDFGFDGENYYDHIDELRVGRKSWSPIIKQELSAAHASDFFTWDLLSGDGGYYSDMDVLYVNPMTRVIDDVGDSDAMFCLQDRGMAIGFLGACPKCPIFPDVHCAAVACFKNVAYQCAGTQAVYNASGVIVTKKNSDHAGELVLASIQKMHPQLHVASINGDSIYYYNWIDHVYLYDRSHVEDVRPEHIGYHWFGGSPSSQSWNRRLTAGNIQDFDIPFCRLAARYV